MACHKGELSPGAEERHFVLPKLRSLPTKIILQYLLILLNIHLSKFQWTSLKVGKAALSEFLVGGM